MNGNSTPLQIVALVSNHVSRTVDRLVGDRFRCPLLVSHAVVKSLEQLGIRADTIYGKAAWIEVLSDGRLAWVGSWEEDRPHFWVQTQFGEIVDLNLSASSRDKSNGAVQSPPMLWAARLPRFARYRPVGVAEFAAPSGESESEKPAWLALEEIRRLMKNKLPSHGNTNITGAGRGTGIDADELDFEFADEPILVPDLRVLDDSRGTFQAFDRALSVGKFEAAPIS